MAGPLNDVRVVELGGIGPVPHAGMMLADLGADVITVTRPQDPQAIGGSGGVLDRGKRSIAVDLRTAEGAELVRRLAATSHVLIEGFRPGVAERLGLGPVDMAEVNPGLVFGRMTGWGQAGPLAARAGHDIDYLAVTGALDAIGPVDRPYPPLNLVGDFGGGSMLLVVGVLAALHRGKGEVVDAAMVDGAALLMAMHHGGRADGWWRGVRGGDLFDGSAPFYTTYATSDGKWMAVGALEPRFYSELVAGLGLYEADLPDQMDRDGWADLAGAFSRVFATRTRTEWEEIFSATDACVAGVYGMDEAPRHPHLAARSTFVEMDGVMQPSPAPRMADTSPPGPVPRPGQHTREMLASLGIEPAEVSRLHDIGVVHTEECSA